MLFKVLVALSLPCSSAFTLPGFQRSQSHARQRRLNQIHQRFLKLSQHPVEPTAGEVLIGEGPGLDRLSAMEALIDAQEGVIKDCEEDIGCAVEEANQMKVQIDAFLHHNMQEFVDRLQKNQVEVAGRVRGIVKRRHRLIRQAAEGQEEMAAYKRVLAALQQEAQRVRALVGGASEDGSSAK